MNIFICTNSYDENSGGAIVMHRLCHLINEHSNNKSFLVPLDPLSYGRLNIRKIASKIKWVLNNKKKFTTKNGWNTPVWTSNEFPIDAVVIYPEIVNNNPLKIKNVVRWLLHQPGYHTDKISYNIGELYFKFNSAIKDFSVPGSKTSHNELKVIYYPIDIYHSNTAEVRDNECCFLVRKGVDKNQVHPQGAVQLDGLTHSQMAGVFRRSKKFICYDDYTAYSIFAVLCGCKSYVVPNENQTITDWYPNETDRYGLSFGFSEEQEQWADKTQHKVYEHILAEHDKTIVKVSECLNEMASYFGLINKNSEN